MHNWSSKTRIEEDIVIYFYRKGGLNIILLVSMCFTKWRLYVKFFYPKGEVPKSSMDEQASTTKSNNILDKDNYIKPAASERSQGNRTPDSEVMQLCLPSCVERALRRQESNRESASSEMKDDDTESEKDSLSRLPFKKTDPIHIKPCEGNCCIYLLSVQVFNVALFG